MAKIEIELDSEEIQNLLKSDEISAICEEEAARMTRATGMEYVPDIRIGKTRVVAAGYRKLSKTDGRTGICPKCGEWHPNCRCNVSRK